MSVHLPLPQPPPTLTPLDGAYAACESPPSTPKGDKESAAKGEMQPPTLTRSISGSKPFSKTALIAMLGNSLNPRKQQSNPTTPIKPKPSIPSRPVKSLPSSPQKEEKPKKKSGVTRDLPKVARVLDFSNTDFALPKTTGADEQASKEHSLTNRLHLIQLKNGSNSGFNAANGMSHPMMFPPPIKRSNPASPIGRSFPKANDPSKSTADKAKELSKSLNKSIEDNLKLHIDSPSAYHKERMVVILRDPVDILDKLEREHMHRCWLTKPRQNLIPDSAYNLSPQLKAHKLEVEKAIEYKLRRQVTEELNTVVGAAGWVENFCDPKEKAALQNVVEAYNKELKIYEDRCVSLRRSFDLEDVGQDIVESALFAKHFAGYEKARTQRDQSLPKWLPIDKFKGKITSVLRAMARPNSTLTLDVALKKLPDHISAVKEFLSEHKKKTEEFNNSDLIKNRILHLRKIEEGVRTLKSYEIVTKYTRDTNFAKRCFETAFKEILSLMQEDERHSFARFPTLFNIHIAFHRAIVTLNQFVPATVSVESPREFVHKLMIKKFTELRARPLKLVSPKNVMAPPTPTNPISPPNIVKPKNGNGAIVDLTAPNKTCFLYRRTQGKHSINKNCNDKRDVVTLLFTQMFSKKWVEVNFKFEDSHVKPYPGVFSLKYFKVLDPSDDHHGPALEEFSAHGYGVLSTFKDINKLAEAYTRLFQNLQSKHQKNDQFMKESIKTVLMHSLMFSSSVEHLPSICNKMDVITEQEIKDNVPSSPKSTNSVYKRMIQDSLLQLMATDTFSDLKSTMGYFKQYIVGCAESLRHRLSTLTAVSTETASVAQLLERSLVINRCFALLDILATTGYRSMIPFDVTLLRK